MIRDLVKYQSAFNKIPARGRDDCKQDKRAALNIVIPDSAQRVIRDLVKCPGAFNKIPAQGRDDRSQDKRAALNIVIPDSAQRVIRDLVKYQSAFNKIPAQGRDDYSWAIDPGTRPGRPQLGHARSLQHRHPGPRTAFQSRSYRFAATDNLRQTSP
ncbi:hypothetical protein E3W66_09990 [Gammaproteobacteria bacterium LSUCC0057]|uniref:Uncharacterized protein n=1 Tax=Gammaproteobacteria bacterium LSUCC0057 TaxID=2559237 RepID=A0A4Y8UE23_9GAMM|nr:hypothetical protein E3W66_09990 [Gammaproteobacteria bacterium LSUCC0057]